MGMTHRDVIGREVGGGSCLGTHVRIKDFKIKKIKKKVKEESEKVGLKFSIQKTRSWQLAPSLHGK